MKLIEGKGLNKSYFSKEIEIKALTDVEFEINPAMLVSFVGPSGSGKTTLLNLIGVLDKPTSGRLMVAGKEVSTLDRKSRAVFRGENIGFVFQNFNLLPALTIYENVEYPLVMVRNVPAAERAKRVIDLLESVGMSDLRNKYPDQISGGQKQRVAVARALVTHPKLVLADEPTANLDSKTAFMVIDLMKKMKNDFETTFLFSTHDHKIVDNAEIIYTLEDGRITDISGNGGRKQ